MDSSIDQKVINLIFIGDSDIARWPESQLPSISTHPVLQHHNLKQVIFNHSQNGALLANIPSQVQKALKEVKVSACTGTTSTTNFFIACAGENDLSHGFSVDTVMTSFHNLLETIFATNDSDDKLHFIFFGPKLEPWLNDDVEARTSYDQLSERMAIDSLKYSYSSSVLMNGGDGDCGDCSHSPIETSGPKIRNVTFIDTLTHFCGETADDMGSVHSTGTCRHAQAQSKFFDEDGLHLSEEGYALWKEELELLLSRILCNEHCIDSLDHSHGKKIVLD